MSNTKNLANLAAALDDGTSGQVLQSTGSGGVQFADSTGSGVTVHANQAAMLTDAASASEGTLHYETDTNKLYVKQTSGFYLLASITNASPTIDSFSENTGGAGANNLTAGGTFTLTSGSNTVITINATEPDLETISYSATVTSGTATDVFSSPSFPVTNQSSNVFTLTPVTSGTGGTVTIRFDASDGTNVANVSHSFEIAFVIADSHYTTLLMATDGSAGDNDTITYDTSSTTGNSLTVNGAPYAGSFSPYRSGGFSAYMGGNGNYISTTHATSLKPSGTDDFCVSLWYWPNATPSTNTQVAGDFRVVSYPTNCNGWDILHLTSNVLAVRWAYPNYIDMNSGSTTLNIGEWNHIVYCKNNSTMSLFINGTRVNTTTSNIGMTASTLGSFYIGWAGSSSGSTEHSINGYITDFKLDIGGNNAFDATATSITVPTERATLGNNTKLFACHLPYLKDGSTSEHTLSFTGSSTGIKPLAPYDYDEYSESTNGGSVYFDGSDYLSAANSSSFDLGANDFTIEMWLNFNVTTGQTIIAKWWTGGSQWVLQFRAAGQDSITNQHWRFYANNGTTAAADFQESSTTSVKTDVWGHIALVRSGNSYKFFRDGVQIGSTYTNSSEITSTTDILSIGQFGNGSTEFFNGHISDLRIVKGTAVYSGAFTPPTGPLTTTGGTYPSTTNVNTSITSGHTKLLLKGTDAHVIDKSQGNNLKLVGTAASTSALTSGSTPPYIGAAWANTSAVSFDGNSDYVIMPQIPLGSGDFTIEAYTYLDARLTSYPAIFSNYNSFSAGALGLFAGHGSSTTTNYQVAHNGAGFPSINGGPITYDQWVHLCLERYNGTITLYKDGSSVNSFASTATLNGVGSNFYIGTTGDSISTSYINGWIQDFRVTVGRARYQGAFTKPAAPLKG